MYMVTSQTCYSRIHSQLKSTFSKESNSYKWLGKQHNNVYETGKRCVILWVFIILRWSFNYESNVFRYNKILIDYVFGNSKFDLSPCTFMLKSTFSKELDIVMLFPQSFIRVWFFWESRLQHKCTWWQVKLAIPEYIVYKYFIIPKNIRIIKYL
jgi:hypothetical protein